MLKNNLIAYYKGRIGLLQLLTLDIDNRLMMNI